MIATALKQKRITVLVCRLCLIQYGALAQRIWRLSAGMNWGFDLSQIAHNALKGANIVYDTHPYPYADKQPQYGIHRSVR